MRRKFVVIDETYPQGDDADIRWICRVMGFSTSRDRTGLPAKILEMLLRNKSVSEEELASRLGVSRTAISHHMEKMRLSGMVIKERGHYILAGNSLEEVLEDMKHDMIRAVERIQRISREIDRKFNLIGRV